MKIILIAAVAKNRVIGRNNDLIWHMPDDLKFFKKTTLGHPVIMARKTFESFGRPLPGRTNIILSRGNQPPHPDVLLFQDLEKALAHCRNAGHSECYIAGGQQIYELAMPIADRLIITEIHETFEGDTFFPEFDEMTWKEISRTDHKADEKNPYAYSFVIWERRSEHSFTSKKSVT